MKYLTAQPTIKKTPQSQPIPGREKEMSRNYAGGVAFTADCWTKLDRFLILGSEGGSYYVGEADLTKTNLDNVRTCIANDGPRTIKTIVDVSVGGRAPKNDPAIYALALAASYGGDVRTREMALAVLPQVARTGTHLFTFCEFIDSMRGWGAQLRHGVAQWYLQKPADKLAYQLIKYQQRNGWSHKDVMRLAHPNPGILESHGRLFKYAMGKAEKTDWWYESLPTIVTAFENAKTADEKTVIKLIRNNGLTREMIPTEHQKSPAVWEALLEKMPLTALIRTLGRMSASGLLAPLSEASKEVVRRLTDTESLRKSRVHPIAVLTALLTYRTGHGLKGKLTWTPVPTVVDALDEAFYRAFAHVEPTGKNFYLGIDVSGSMTSGQVAGVEGLTPNMGAAAMAMLVARTEPNHFIGGFATQFVDLGVSSRDRLDAAMKKCHRSFGGTDCAVAIKHAHANHYPVDAFVVITDGETWAGDMHASQALTDYRQKTGRDSKLIVINMVANRTRLTDPTDAGSLDVVGFDASVPTVIAGFLGASNNALHQSEVED